MARQRRRDLAILVGIALAFAALAQLVRNAPLAAPPLPDPETLLAQPGARTPSLVLPSLAGGVRSLEDWRGEWVLLNFWATWCAPCRRELPSLEALHRALSAEGLAVIAVSVDSVAPERVARFAAERGVSFALLHDARGEAAGGFGVWAYPTSFLIDREGRVVHTIPSAWNWADESVITWLRQLLAQ